MIVPKRFSEALGLWAGGLVAPMFAIGSLLRQERVFHARGLYVRAEVEAAEGVHPALEPLVEALTQSDALMRLSAGLYKGNLGLLPDVLGMAIRFGGDPAQGFMPRLGAQDLTLITARRILALPLAMLATDQQDFLANVFHGAGPFEIAGHPWMRIRVKPLGVPVPASSRDRFARLRAAIEAGEVRFRLEIESMLDASLGSAVVDLHLVEEVEVDEETLGFWPFRRGQPIRPMGLVQFMRPVPYLLSEWARKV